MQNINPVFTIQKQDPIQTVFTLDVSPSKVSQLENDLDFQTKTDVENAIQQESEIINERIDNEVEQLQAEIEQATNNIQGSALINVEKTDQIVTVSSKTFVFEQAIASNTWRINHNLNKHPSIELTYNNGQAFEAKKEYIDNNNVVIYMNSAATGFAYLN